jgi:hypothetical protein
MGPAPSKELRDYAGRTYTVTGGSSKTIQEIEVQKYLDNQNKIAQQLDQNLNQVDSSHDQSDRNYYRKLIGKYSENDQDMMDYTYDMGLRDEKGTVKVRSDMSDNLKALEDFNKQIQQERSFYEQNKGAGKMREFYKGQGAQDEELYRRMRYKLGASGAGDPAISARTGSDQEYKDWESKYSQKVNNLKTAVDSGLKWRDMDKEQRDLYMDSISSFSPAESATPVVVNPPQASNMAVVTTN